MDTDFIDVDEVVTYIITCRRCKIRFKAESFDAAAGMVRKHLKNSHGTEQETGNE